ncbi:MAG: LysR family transcriptional regulator [Francisellaceae bacterium]
MDIYNFKKNKTHLESNKESGKVSNLDKLSILLLRVFNSVMRKRSVTLAAEELFMTPAAVSNALVRLREIFNDPLFIRRKNTLMPTKKAESLLPEIAKIVGILSSINGEKAYDPYKRKHHFRIGVTQITKYTTQARILEVLFDYPVTLEFIPIDYYYPADAEEYPDLDLLLGLSAPADQLHNKKFYEDYLAVVGREENPLLQKESFTLDEYIKAKHIVIHELTTEHNPVLKYIGTPDPREIILRMSEIHEVINLLSRTEALITTGLIFAHEYQHRSRKKLAIRLFPIKHPHSFYIAWPIMANNDRANIWLREQILNNVMIDKPEIPLVDRKVSNHA